MMIDGVPGVVSIHMLHKELPDAVALVVMDEHAPVGSGAERTEQRVAHARVRELDIVIAEEDREALYDARASRQRAEYLRGPLAHALQLASRLVLRSGPGLVGFLGEEVDEVPVDQELDLLSIGRPVGGHLLEEIDEDLRVAEHGMLVTANVEVRDGNHTAHEVRSGLWLGSSLSSSFCAARRLHRESAGVAPDMRRDSARRCVLKAVSMRLSLYGCAAP
ncbi:hypothetical protein WME94_31330 [Sorangium sp. So ce429]